MLHLNLEAISHLETAAQLYQPSPTLMRLIYKNLGQSEAESGNKAKPLMHGRKLSLMNLMMTLPLKLNR
jgi:hypothetical protein